MPVHTKPLLLNLLLLFIIISLSLSRSASAYCHYLPQQSSLFLFSLSQFWHISILLNHSFNCLATNYSGIFKTIYFKCICSVGSPVWQIRDFFPYFDHFISGMSILISLRRSALFTTFNHTYKPRFLQLFCAIDLVIRYIHSFIFFLFSIERKYAKLSQTFDIIWMGKFLMQRPNQLSAFRKLIFHLCDKKWSSVERLVVKSVYRRPHSSHFSVLQIM